MAVGPILGFTQTAYKQGLKVTIAAGTAVISGSVVQFSTSDMTVPANTLSYIYLNLTSGTIQQNTSGFPTSSAYPICTVQTQDTYVSTLTDMRPDVQGSSGGGTWGSITGTLSSQTDLQTALTNASSSFNVVDIAKFSPHADGITDDSAAFTAADANGEIWLTPGKSYYIGSNLTLNSDLRFFAGSKLIVSNSVTLKLKGTVHADPNQQIFSCPVFTQTATDNFLRANENPLSDGGMWAACGYSGANTGLLTGDVAQPTATSSTSMPLWTGGGAFAANQYSEATVHSFTNDGISNTGVIVRGVTSASTFYLAWVSGQTASTKSLYIYKFVAGTPTLLYGTAGNSAGAVVAGDKIRLVAYGTTLYLFYNGNLITTVNDSSISTGYPGFYATSADGAPDAQISLWTGGTVGGYSNIVFAGQNQMDVYPEWFGAVGNGSADDSLAIQQAIQSLSNCGVGYATIPPSNPGGGCVVLQNKNYAVAGGTDAAGANALVSGTALTINASWVNVRGQGRRNCCITMAGNTAWHTLIITGTAFSAAGLVAFTKLSDFCLLRSASGTGSAAGVYSVYTVAGTIERVDSFDAVTGFYQTGCGDIVYRDCYAGAQNHACVNGWYFDNTGTPGSTGMESTVVENCSATSATNGFYFNQGTSQNCDIFMWTPQTAACGTGLYINGSGAQSGNYWHNGDIQLHNAIFDGCSTQAIYITNHIGSGAFVDIIGGEFSKTSANPTVTITGSSGVRLIGCQIYAGAVTSGAHKGVLIGGGSYGCTVDSCGIYGLNTSDSSGYMVQINGSSDNVVSNNVIQSEASAIAFNIGIQGISATYNMIKGNVLRGYGTTGLNYDSGTLHNITDNLVDTTNITTAKTDSSAGGTNVATGN